MDLAADKMGHEIIIETRGSIGAENILKDEDIADADLVFLAVEINVHKDRFQGKPVYETGTHEVATDPERVLDRAIKWLHEEYDSKMEAGPVNFDQAEFYGNSWTREMNDRHMEGLDEESLGQGQGKNKPSAQ